MGRHRLFSWVCSFPFFIFLVESICRRMTNIRIRANRRDKLIGVSSDGIRSATDTPITMDGPGTVTWDEFLMDAKSFVRVSNEISDSWQLHGDEEAPGQAYLCRRVRTAMSSDLAGKLIQKCHAVDVGEDPYEAAGPAETPIVVEHHILWSMSYGVPVLYFNAWISDFPGVNPVTVESVQALVQQGAVGYAELSQAIHPILGTTFLQFHPCMSKELLQNASKSKNKLVSWLSTVAPSALNLKLRSEYFNLTLGQNPELRHRS